MSDLPEGPDGSTPGHVEPDKPSSAAWVFTPLLIAFLLTGVAAGWFLRSERVVTETVTEEVVVEVPSPVPPTGQGNLRHLAEKRVLAGCIPVTLVQTFGDTEADVEAETSRLAGGLAQRYPDATAFEVRAVEIPPDSPVLEHYPGAVYVGVVHFERCLEGAA